MSTTVIRIYRDTNAPPVPITFADVDLTGSEVELVLSGAGAPVTLSTETGELALALPDGVVWTYDEALALSLKLGQRTKFDVFRILGESREKIGAGWVDVGGAGEFDGDVAVVVQVPGIQGPPPWTYYGAWAAGTYAAKSSVSHNGSTWLTLVETTEEPGVGDDWEVLLDGSGAADDRAAAEAAASTATGAASTATTKAGEATAAAATATTKAGEASTSAGTAYSAASAADADAAQVAADKATVAADKATVASDKTTVQGIYNAVTAAPTDIAASTYTIQAGDLGKTLQFTGACVVTLPATFTAGFWCHLCRAGTGAVTWFVESGGTKNEVPAGTGIAVQWGDVTARVTGNVGGSAAHWVVGGYIS